MDEIRINKFLSEMGVCSRREADRMIEAGRVTIDGVAVTPGTKVSGDMTVRVDGNPVGKVDDISSIRQVLIAVNKPVGVVCTTTDNDRAPNIVDMVNYPTRIYPIGRLDKDSEGLILMTNRGDIVNAMMKESNYHEKEYIVKVSKTMTTEFIEQMRSGVYLHELKRKTRPCRVKAESMDTFSIVLTQGLNRQIRRMCAELGYKVMKLTRVRIMNIELGHLKPGTYRNVTGNELEVLEADLADTRA